MPTADTALELVPTRLKTASLNNRQSELEEAEENVNTVDVPTLHAPAAALSDSKSILHNHWVHLGALCWTLFLQGWNDGTIGPLIPRIRELYHVGYMVVSLLFVVSCVGIILGAVTVVWFERRFGFGKTIIIGAFLQLSGYVVASTAPPFPVLVVGYGISGLGISILVSQCNAFVGSLKRRRSLKLCLLHASYGIGAFLAPFSSTRFATVRKWSFHYIISASFAVVNIVILVVVFRLKRKEALLLEEGQDLGTAPTLDRNVYRQILGIKAVHLLTAFVLVYIGVEVTIGGWIVSFVLQERDGGPNSGYISSGFFGGLTIGRLVLIWVNSKVGEYRVIFIYGILAIILEITIWTVPSLIENAVAVSFIGIVLGPMFPLLIGHASRIIPSSIFTGCLSWITGMGAAGSTAIPFATGVLASRYGIASLQPLIVGMMSFLLLTWAFVPKDRRTD
ncbi:MFS general substrate transporter [Hymenopellis radicata]|nr:MFS general substrate transporter [Hymenopellis radicata]